MGGLVMRVSGREEKVLRGVKQITCGTFETFLDFRLFLSQNKTFETP